MRAASPLFHQPPRNTHVAAEFRAMRTQMGLLQLFHANKAAKDIIQALETRKKMTRY